MLPTISVSLLARSCTDQVPSERQGKGRPVICSIKRLRTEVSGRALFDISAVELQGRFCAIYGPSGVGKSTFLKALANGEADTASGAVTCCKLLSFNNGITNIRYIPQHPPRFNFTVRSFFDRMLVANRQCEGCASTLEEACSEFDLAPILKSCMNDISGGQLHRVHLAAGLSSNADLLLLDEPTAALDRKNVAILVRLLHEFVEQRNGYVICCTHDASFRSRCDLHDRWHALEFPSFNPVEDDETEKIFGT